VGARRVAAHVGGQQLIRQAAGGQLQSLPKAPASGAFAFLAVARESADPGAPEGSSPGQTEYIVARRHGAQRAGHARRRWYAPAMTVYVDDAVTLWRGRRWAHLMADSLDELHAFAARLGLPRHAFQDKTSGAHYDVNAELREHAIALGAVAISRHRDRDLVRAVIARAKAQGRREAP
jgi:hypothetical protein